MRNLPNASFLKMHVEAVHEGNKLFICDFCLKLKLSRHFEFHLNLRILQSCELQN